MNANQDTICDITNALGGTCVQQYEDREKGEYVWSVDCDVDEARDAVTNVELEPWLSVDVRNGKNGVRVVLEQDGRVHAANAVAQRGPLRHLVPVVLLALVLFAFAILWGYI